VDTSNLKKIRILEPYGQFDEDDYHDNFPSGNISLLASRQLEEVEITSATRLLPSLEIAWDNITAAKMEGISLNSTFKILLLTPRLKTCKISCREIEPPEDDPPWLSLPLDLPLTHNALESFEFYSPSRDITQLLLQGVNLPSLKEFKFDEFGFSDNALVKHLISFFQRSPCPLTSLSLSLHFDAINDDILNPLNALPTLTHFSINVPGAGDAFMTGGFLQEPIQPTSGSPKMVAPRLRAFFYMGPLNLTWPAFLKIFGLPSSSISHSDCHKRPLRDVSLQIECNEEVVINDDITLKLRTFRAEVNLTIVAGEIDLVI
jgi:hypothetical protein